MWGTIFKLLAGAALAGLTIYAGVKIYKKITAQRIAEEVARKAKEAVYAKIKEKKANAVKVGIFDVNEKETGEMEIKSDEGVDSSLRVGQLIAVI
ncbi:MAG: hypothetical protein U0J38_07515 [Bacteroidales bacterium]|jgi:hypothetical protein|nr:hypothetical protein [Bacteroidales bacterium]MED9962993.1 hypothetical protein [Bacteroidales bacterium]MEE0899793.1 hypothetical protein [Bacteroidales bacterium]MEE1118369.1 hypothetical protein [Bacteroidales bacterium]MEE1253186.1 hypothetical protein [Bacteroidales bacterium]